MAQTNGTPPARFPQFRGADFSLYLSAPSSPFAPGWNGLRAIRMYRVTLCLSVRLRLDIATDVGGVGYRAMVN
jgi:hypothetical protein